MSHSRLLYVDCLKGFAIFLVVLGHVVQNYHLEDSWIFRIIYSFHMPLFMFMSGYVCFRKYDWAMIKKRAIQLLIPFFSYIPVKYGLDILLGGSRNMSLTEYLCRVVYQPDMGLWFLWALFFITVLFIASRRLSGRFHIPEWVMFAVVAGLLNGIVIFGNVRQFGFHWIAWYFIYFCAGVMWRTWNERRNDTRKFDFRLLISCAVVFPVMVYFFRMHNEPPTFYQWINLGRLFPVAYRLVIGMVGTMLVYELFKLYGKQTERLYFLSRMGEVTLGIYYIHFLILQIVFTWPFFEDAVVVGICIYTVIVSIISYALSKACLRYWVPALLVMGKWPHRADSAIMAR